MSDDLQKVIKELAPHGTLRVGLNQSNAVLVQRGKNGAEPTGITVSLAEELARRLGIGMRLVKYERPAEVADAAPNDIWDICFLAIDPLRAEVVEFTEPYILIAGVYAVPEKSPLVDVDKVDSPGIKIGVGQGSAYDLHLTRAIKHAQIVRSVKGGKPTVQYLVDGDVDVVAGVRQPLEAFIAANPGYRKIAKPFMEIRQAMGLPAGRPLAAKYAKAFIEDVKRSGFVAKKLAEHGQNPTEAAPPAA